MTGVLLDLGGLGPGQDGWLTVNLAPGVDRHADLLDPDSYAEDGTVDEFLCSHTLEHIPLPELQGWLHRLRAKLRPGGRLTVIQTDARRALALYGAGRLAFSSLRDVLFVARGPRAEIIEQTGRDLQVHQYAWGAEDLRSELIVAGFVDVYEFDGGAWTFNIAGWLPSDTNEADFGFAIPNLGVRAHRPSS